MPINANMSSQTPMSLPYRPPHYLQFSPIITVMASNEHDHFNEEYPIETRLTFERDVINTMSDLPPLYHQLDVMPTERPPTYEEAIEDKGQTNQKD